MGTRGSPHRIARTVAVLTVVYAMWLQETGPTMTVVIAILVGVLLLVLEKSGVIDRGLAWVKDRKPSREARQDLVAWAKKGVELYNRPFMADGVWEMAQGYQGWRGVIVAMLEQRFPEKDEAQFREALAKALPQPERIIAISPEHLNLKQQLRRDLDVLEKIIHRRTPFRLGKAWRTPWGR